MREEEVENYIKLSSIPLVKVGKDLKPIGGASGCLIDYKGKRLLLTVYHATGDMGNWAIQIRYEPGRGTQLFGLGGMNFLKAINLQTLDSQDVDFAYVAVQKDLEVYFQELGKSYEVISEVTRKICKVDFELEPSKDERYGFSGLIKGKFDGVALKAEHKVYLNLRFLEKTGDFLVFKLPMKHPGHEFFQGCSGAPITDTKGNTVALVCWGDKETDQIYGISLKKYQTPIEIEYGNVGR